MCFHSQNHEAENDLKRSVSPSLCPKAEPTLPVSFVPVSCLILLLKASNDGDPTLSFLKTSLSFLLEGIS